MLNLMQKLVEQGWYLSGDGLRRLVNDLQTVDIRIIKFHALNWDLCDIGGGVLPSDPLYNDHIPGPLVLQLQGISFSDCNGEKWTTPPYRRLVFSDGVRNITALELGPITKFNQNLPPGTKICIDTKYIQIHQGLLVLKPDEIHVLGGQLKKSIFTGPVSRNGAINSQFALPSLTHEPLMAANNNATEMEASQNMSDLNNTDETSLDTSKMERDFFNISLNDSAGQQAVVSPLEGQGEEGATGVTIDEEGAHGLNPNVNPEFNSWCARIKEAILSPHSHMPPPLESDLWSDHTAATNTGGENRTLFTENNVGQQQIEYNNVTNGSANPAQVLQYASNYNRDNDIAEPPPQFPPPYIPAYTGVYQDNNCQQDIVQNGQQQHGQQQNIHENIDNRSTNTYNSGNFQQFYNTSYTEAPMRSNSFPKWKPMYNHGSRYGDRYGNYNTHNYNRGNQEETYISSQTFTNKSIAVPQQMMIPPQMPQESLNHQHFNGNAYDPNTMMGFQNNNPNEYAIFESQAHYRQQNGGMLATRMVYGMMPTGSWPWNIGEFCLARYWQDGIYYYAKVTALTDRTCVVFFIGYGNHEEVFKSDCLPIPPGANHPFNTFRYGGHFPQQPQPIQHHLAPLHQDNANNPGDGYNGAAGGTSANGTKRRPPRQIYVPPPMRSKHHNSNN